VMIGVFGDTSSAIVVECVVEHGQSGLAVGGAHARYLHSLDFM
jgi:hypothetical protein